MPYDAESEERIRQGVEIMKEIEVYRTSGDKSVCERLYHRHIGLIRTVLKQTLPFCPCNMQPEDVEANATLGFFEALSRFDPTQHANFSSYAWHWIRGAVIQGEYHASGLKRMQFETVCRREEISLHFLEDASSMEMADPADPIGGAEENMILHSIRQTLDAAIERLPCLQRKIIREHYYNGMSLRSISRKVNKSAMWISRQHQLALRNLHGEVARNAYFCEEKSIYLAERA